MFFPNFLLTTSETMSNYYLKTGYIQVASRVAEAFSPMGGGGGRGLAPTQEKKRFKIQPHGIFADGGEGAQCPHKKQKDLRS